MTGPRITLSNGQKIGYDVFGVDSDRPVLVMLHGRGTRKELFYGMVQSLAQWYVVVLLDLPGHGDSKVPPSAGGYRVEQMADALHEALVILGYKRYHLFGFSLGGVVALEMVRQHPTVVQSLTTAGTHYELITVPRFLIWLDRKTRQWMGEELLFNWFLRLVWCRSNDEYQALQRVVLNGLEHNTDRDLAILEQMPLYDYRTTLGTFTQMGKKVYLLKGEKDWQINSGLRETEHFVRLNRCGEIAFAPGGHYGFLQWPQTWATQIHVWLQFSE